MPPCIRSRAWLLQSSRVTQCLSFSFPADGGAIQSVGFDRASLVCVLLLIGMWEINAWSSLVMVLLVLVTIYGGDNSSIASRGEHRGGVLYILTEAIPYGYRGKC